MPAACRTLDDEAFLDAFEAGTLEAFGHRDHVRLAWLYLRREPVLAALSRFVDGLKRFVTARGQPGLYHETLTFAFFFLIYERMARLGLDASWDAFTLHNADLITGGKAFLDAYYRPETLASDLARAVFVLPDRGSLGR